MRALGARSHLNCCEALRHLILTFPLRELVLQCHVHLMEKVCGTWGSLGKSTVRRPVELLESRYSGCGVLAPDSQKQLGSDLLLMMTITKTMTNTKTQTQIPMESSLAVLHGLCAGNTCWGSISRMKKHLVRIVSRKHFLESPSQIDLHWFLAISEARTKNQKIWGYKLWWNSKTILNSKHVLRWWKCFVSPWDGIYVGGYICQKLKSECWKWIYI